MIKRMGFLFLLITLIAAVTLPETTLAGIENNQAIPDEIAILNNSDGVITVNGIATQPGETLSVAVNTTASDTSPLLIRKGWRAHILNFPHYTQQSTPSTRTVAHLDYTTIFWYAGLHKSPLNQITIYNDSHSLITLMYSLNGLTPPTKIKPEQSKTKKIALTDKAQSKKGAVLISDGSQSYTVEFLRHLHQQGMIETADDIREVTLRISTIHWFNNGFTV
jgi:hypothetical protein